MNHKPLSRRNFVTLLSGASMAANVSFYSNNLELPVKKTLPAKDLFSIKGTYINAAYTHPMSKGSYHQIQKFLNERMGNRLELKTFDGFERASVTASFAKLINASSEEIAWIPSTMFGENFVVHALDIPKSKAHVVTDALHFHGSLHLYNTLSKGGCKLTCIKPRENKIELEEIRQAIRPDTKLISVSLVSATTGFSHDLKKLCEIAHAQGVMVYADIIQAAGAVPIDVKETNVDFCACATYKWLMGDFGIGFLYIRKDRLPLMQRSFIGYRQMSGFVSHILPYESPGDQAFESESAETMSGHFEIGTFANEGINALRYSIPLLNEIGVEKIYQYRKPMIDRLQNELPKAKYIPLTPSDSVSPIVCFAFKDAAKILKPKLDAADISISVYEHMIRISPSIYNDMNDIEKLISVLRKG